MIKFDLKDMYSGWKHSSTPDDLNIDLQIASTTHNMNASLRDLLVLYGRVLSEQEGSITIGTGRVIDLEQQNSHLYFSKQPLYFRTSFQDLQDALEQLLTEVFEAKDEIDGQEKRSEQLEYLQKWVQKRDLEYNVQDLYERLGEESADQQ